MKKLLISFSVFVFSGCASVNSVSLTPIPAARNKVVTAKVDRTIFLAFNFDNDYVEPLVEDLKLQCPNGVVSGILTKDESYFYVLVTKRQVTATGFCSQAVAKKSASQSNPQTSSRVQR